jgi:hypothetical protein
MGAAITWIGRTMGALWVGMWVISFGYGSHPSRQPSPRLYPRGCRRGLCLVFARGPLGLFPSMASRRCTADRFAFCQVETKTIKDARRCIGGDQVAARQRRIQVSCTLGEPRNASREPSVIPPICPLGNCNSYSPEPHYETSEPTARRPATR